MLTRIITGVVGIALAAFIIQTGGALFSAFALVLSLVAWLEYVRAFAHKGIRGAFVLGALGLVLLWGCAWLGNAEETMAVTTGIVLLILLESVLLHGRFSFEDAAVSVAGVLYFGYPFAHMVLLRFAGEGQTLMTPLGAFDFGCAMIWVMFIGTWASDTFAYFVGSAIGSHKLCPTISPNKTVEGFLGSLVGTTASVAGLGVFFGLPVLEMAGPRAFGARDARRSRRVCGEALYGHQGLGEYHPGARRRLGPLRQRALYGTCGVLFRCARAHE